MPSRVWQKQGILSLSRAFTKSSKPYIVNAQVIKLGLGLASIQLSAFSTCKKKDQSTAKTKELLALCAAAPLFLNALDKSYVRFPAMLVYQAAECKRTTIASRMKALKRVNVSVSIIYNLCFFAVQLVWRCMTVRFALFMHLKEQLMTEVPGD